MITRFFLIILATCSTAHAIEEAPQALTLDGRLYSNLSTKTPLLDTGLFKIQILDFSGLCILYEEQQAFDTRGTDGAFNINIGESSSTNVKRTSDDSGHTLSTVFANDGGTISGKLLSNGSPCTGAASAGNTRSVLITVIPDSNPTPRVMDPFALNSVPSAIVAERAESLEGIKSSGFLQVRNTAPYSLSQSNLENIFSTTNYSKLTDLLTGTTNLYVHSGSNGTMQAPTVSGTPTSPVAGQIWYDSGVIKYYDGSSAQSLSAGSGVTSLIVGAGLTPTGTISTGGQTIAVDVGVAAGKIVQVQTGGKLPALDGSDLTNILINGGQTGAVTAGTNDATALTLETGNSPRMTITSTGNIGVGTTSASNRFEIKSAGASTSPLHIQNLAGSSIFDVSESSGNAGTLSLSDASGTATVRLHSNGVTSLNGGNVGVGLGDPDVQMEVKNNLRIRSTSGSYAAIARTMDGIDLVSPSLNVSTSLYGIGLKFMSKDTDFTTENPKMLAGIFPRATEVYNADTKGGMALDFMTTANNPGASSLPVTRMTIDQSGYVGIGTTTPGDMLHVNGKIRATYICAADGTNCKDLTTAWASGGGTVDLTTLTDGQIVVGKTSSAPQLVTMSGDASINNTGAVTVAKIQGTAVSATAPTAAKPFLRFDGSGWVPSAVGMLDLRSNVTGTQTLATTCSASQTLTYNSATDSLACSNIAIASSAVSGLGAAASLGIGTGLTTSGGNIAADFGTGSGKVVQGNDARLPSSTCSTGNKMRWDGSAWQCETDASGTGDFKRDGSLAMTGDFNTGENYILGSTTSGASLTLDSTSHATKGYVRIQPYGGNVGIGTNTPVSLLELTSQSTELTVTAGGPFAGTGAGVVIQTTVGSSGSNPMGLYMFDLGSETEWYAGRPAGAGLSDQFVIGRKATTVHDVTTSSVSNTFVQISSAGNVGIGTTTPVAKLNVHGAIVSDTTANAAAVTSIDFATGNVQSSSNSTNNPAIKICGIKDGGAYTLAMTAQPSGSVPTFTAYSDSTCATAITNVDAGGAALTVTSTTVLYSFIRIGSTVYVTIATGFTH